MENIEKATANPVSVKVDFQYLPKLNFAMQQNSVKVVHRFTLTNPTDCDRRNLVVKVEPSDAFAESFTTFIDVLPAGQTVDVSSFELVPNANFILQLSERLEASLHLTVSDAADVLFDRQFPLSVLTYNEWPGIGFAPSLLAAFVTPNSPGITTVLNRAADFLKDWTGDSALNGYQSKDANRVKKMVAAVYEAISELNIIYSEPLASFESVGQRIRLADDVLSTQLGTCLDMAVLYASCLEAIGLFPLIILNQGHAYAGVWLVSDTLPDSVCDDLSLLAKHIGLNDLLLVETTMLCDGHSEPFDRASDATLQKITDKTDFVCAVDIARCRFANVLPLPQKVYDGTQWVVDSRAQEKADTEEPTLVNRWEIQSFVAPELTKQNIWERKLLDLSLRNSLLNYRVSQKAMVLLTSDVTKLEDAIQKGNDFEVLPRQKDMELASGDTPFYAPFSESSPLGQVLSLQMEHKRLYSVLDEVDNKNALKTIYRAAKLSLEECGANSLYLAIGMLEWTEPKVDKPHYAPLLLVPMEMVRRGAGYVIRARDEETMFNVTLLEMLRQNFQITIGGLEPLPTNENGVDVEMAFAIFRNAIMDQKGWNVLNVAVLGNFSFSKLILWNDIHSNLDALKENKIVNSLVEGKLDMEISPSDFSARQLDHNVAPSEMALPVAADSSQLEAVYAASTGKSFILHGPPGTGKSQTITNIIANALYQGKRVLFAAEKMAALSVVQERLAKIGLAPFCLEIHSNKAKKSDVLAQLQTSTEVTKVKSPANFQAEAEKLFDLRQKLNAYVDALHQPSFCGVSLYEAITRYCKLEGEDAECIPIQQEVLLSVTSEKLNEWNTAIEELEVVAGSCGNPATHPLRYLSFSSLESDTAEKLRGLITESLELLEKVKEAVSKNVDVPLDFSTKPKFEASLHLSSILSDLSGVNSTLLVQNDVVGNTPHIISLIERGKTMREIRDGLISTYKDDVFAIDAEGLRREWLDAEGKMFLTKWIARHSVKSKLKKYARNGNINPLSDLEQIIKFQTEKRVHDAHKANLDMFALSEELPPVDVWNACAVAQKKVHDIHTELMVLCADLDQLRSVKRKISSSLSEGIGCYNEYFAPVYRAISQVNEQLSGVNERLKSEYGLCTFAVSDESLPFMEGRIAALQEVGANLNLLKDRFNYLLVRRKVADAGLDFLLERLEAKTVVPVQQWKALFERSFYHALAEYLFGQDQYLTLFKGDMFEANVARFRNVNAQYQELVKAELYARLAARHPDFTIEASTSSEVGVLQKNLRNKGRGTSLRTLFDEIPTMLSKLAPCMLMSPMSIAQYLDVKKQPKFDLVVFDEASQMPTSEAVGAIARGENVIVVGDPKQMPPTSFFSVNSVDEDVVDLNDLESILDDCLALSIPSRYLQYHYRSKHESLISFSNSQYYNSKLVTFPSPDDRVSKVSYVKVEGFYDKGKSRQNKAEAKAVVDEVVRLLSEEESRKRSLGIVTFSAVQQALIDDMLTEVFAKHPELDEAANQCAEPLFVKNLENVQGDERDIILFSVGYGPDEKGNVSMNFGPLNQVGGERRLNVAVSRARYEMKVFSTLTSEHIDLNRTEAEGVRGLKEFLAFAQYGNRTLTQDDMETVKGYESIAELIAVELKKDGYEVDVNVGSSSFRVDVAVVDPNDKGRYLLGILCDGDAYFNSQTARDREICQPGILQGLGWNLMKVWTVDWWNDKAAVIKRIVKVIEGAKKGKVKALEVKEPQTVALEAETESSENVSAGGVERRNYEVASIKTTDAGAEMLVNPSVDKVVISQMHKILKVESPVTAHYLFHRITAAWGVTRITQRVEERLKALLDQTGLTVVESNGQVVVWNDADDAGMLNCFRTPSERESGDIPVEEYCCVLRFVVAQQIALPADELKKQASAILGFARVGTQLDSLMSVALDLLFKQGIIKEEDGRIRMC